MGKMGKPASIVGPSIPGLPALPALPGLPGLPSPPKLTNNPWKALTKWTVDTAMQFPGLVVQNTIRANAFTAALVLLGVCLGIMLVTYILVFIVRPRLFTISHSAAFDDYMLGAAAEVADAMRGLSASISSGDLAAVLSLDNEGLARLGGCGDADADTDGNGDVETMAVLANRILGSLAPISRTDLVSDIMFYYRFNRSLSSMAPYDNPTPNLLARMDMKSEPFFQNDVSGETDIDKVVAFHHDVFLPLSKLRVDVARLSARIHSGCALTMTPAMARGIMFVHLLRLHLHVYHDQTTMSFETRKSGPGRLPLAIMTLYWWPEVEPTYTKSIPHLWKDAPKEFKTGMESYDRKWTELGIFILQLPCYMSYTDNQERIDNCGDVTKEILRVVEGFSIGGLINGVVSLLTHLIPMIVQIAEYISLLASDPMKAILGIFMLVLGMGIGLWGYLLYMFLSITQLYWIWGLVYAFTISYYYAWVLSLWDVVFTVCLAVPYIAVTLLDLLSGGMVMHLLRCESLPSAWAEQPYTAFNNVRERMFGICSVPCTGRGFVPKFDVLCYCEPPDTPPYCPQQQLFRAYRALPVAEPWIFDGFTADNAFHSSNPQDQQRLMAAAYHRKTGFLGRCYSAVSPFSFITRHICSDLDTLLPHATSDEKSKLALLCHQAHCNFGPSSPPTLDDVSASPEAIMLQSARAAFCADPPRVVIKPEPGNAVDALAQAILYLMLAACIVLVILYALLD